MEVHLLLPDYAFLVVYRVSVVLQLQDELIFAMHCNCNTLSSPMLKTPGDPMTSVKSVNLGCRIDAETETLFKCDRDQHVLRT